MKGASHKGFINMLSQMAETDEEFQKFNEFVSEYGDKSDRYVFRELTRMSAGFSKEEREEHLHNLELLGFMKNVGTEDVKYKIELLKRMLRSNKFSNRGRSKNIFSPENQIFFGGFGLFPLLTLYFLFRRSPFFRRPFSRRTIY